MRMRRPTLTARPARPAVLLRLTLLGTGAVALVLSTGGPLGPPEVAAAVGALGLLVAVSQPQGVGPAIVLGAAVLAWAARYGAAAPPLGRTLLLAVLLAVHHQAAALAAALPVTALLDRRLLVRLGTHLALVLALSGLVAVLALGVARPGGSVLLEVAGLVGTVLATAVLVLLGLVRRAPADPGQ